MSLARPDRMSLARLGLARRLALQVGALRAEPAAGRPDPDFRREIGPELLAHDGAPVTELLYDRLAAQGVAEVLDRVAAEPSLPQPPALTDDRSGHRQLVLHYGIWLGVGSVAERTGLRPDQPPDDVHAMARGPLAAAGALYEADMVVSALRSAGVDVTQAERALDFGCSSGRVLRVLAAAYPQVSWHGCDPNDRAIAWATEHLAPAEFFVSLQQPPLPLAEGSLGLVYAISIWSHFAPELGVRWFDEMHRLIRPGGHLVFTTHGLQSVSFYVAQGIRGSEQAAEILRALYRDGWWYAAEFGAAGDDGVINAQWGTAFLTPEWILTKLTPGWRLVEFAAGRNQRNQDLYVLERR